MTFLVTVINEASDKLSRACWHFSTVASRTGRELKLASYVVETRPSRRDRYDVDLERSWSAHNRRAYKLAPEHVPVPADLAARAKAQLIREVEQRMTVVPHASSWMPSPVCG